LIPAKGKFLLAKGKSMMGKWKETTAISFLFRTVNQAFQWVGGKVKPKNF
jgi:hypothetical protein